MASLTYERLDDAIGWAAELHRGQEREGAHPLPYITHPIEVLVNLRYVGGVTDEDELCAAVLHDTVEEANVALEAIEERLGKRVRELVKELTRREPSAKERAGLSKEEIWQLRSDMLLEEIALMSPTAQRIKLADRLSNLREGLRTKLGDKLTRYIGQTSLILQTVPREVSPGLWDAIESEMEHAGQALASL